MKIILQIILQKNFKTYYLFVKEKYLKDLEIINDDTGKGKGKRKRKKFRNKF